MTKIHSTHEQWKDIIGYEGLYQISNTGRVKSFKRGKPKILIPSGKYKSYCLYDGERIYSITKNALILAHYHKGVLLKSVRKRLSYIEIDSDVMKIIDIATKKYNLTNDHIQSLSSVNPIRECRQVIQYLCTVFLDLDYKTIAHMVGGKDRSTIYNTFKSINNLLDTDTNFKIKFNQIEQLCQLQTQEPQQDTTS